MSLSIEEMESELAEFVPAREVMCGYSCGGGGSYASNDHQSFNYDPGAGNDSNGINGNLSPSNNCVYIEVGGGGQELT